MGKFLFELFKAPGSWQKDFNKFEQKFLGRWYLAIFINFWFKKIVSRTGNTFLDLLIFLFEGFRPIFRRRSVALWTNRLRLLQWMGIMIIVLGNWLGSTCSRCSSEGSFPADFVGQFFHQYLLVLLLVKLFLFLRLMILMLHDWNLSYFIGWFVYLFDLL